MEDKVISNEELKEWEASIGEVGRPYGYWINQADDRV